MYAMIRTSLPLLVSAFLFLLLIFPAAAALVISDVSVTPDPPLVPGGLQHVVATYAVIPSGASTFAPGHSLQVQTDLAGAVWAVQVTLNGRNAARQTASGSVVFVNGEILSYSTENDVGMVVTVDGTVPANATGSLTVLQARELDNAGNIVPGSILAVRQQVAGTAPPSTPSITPTLINPLATTPQPKGSPGFSAPFAIAALVAGGMILRVVIRNQ
jgi:hypothetical protein